MIRFPTKFSVLGIDFKVQYFDDPDLICPGDEETAWGTCDCSQRSIKVYRGNRSFTDIWATIFHEVLHAINDTAHLKAFDTEAKDGKERHKELDLLSVALSDTLVRARVLKEEK